MDEPAARFTEPLSGYGPLWVMFWIVFGLAFQTIPLPLPIKVSIAPLSCVIALGVLPWYLPRALGAPATPLSRAITVFVAFVFAHSLIALSVEYLTGGLSELRLLSWGKQIFTIVSGLAVYFVTRIGIQQISDRRLVRFMLIGVAPTLIVSYLNLAWGITGSHALEAIVVGVRKVVVPDGSIDVGRASGLSNEPSYYAYYLVIIVLPMLWAAQKATRKSLNLRLWILVTGVALVGTFSTTGLLIGVLTVLSGSLVTGWGTKRTAVWVLAGVAILIGILALIPENYIFIQGATTIGFLGGQGESNASITDTIFSTLGPIIRLPDSLTSIGYGLGGTATHFRSMVPEAAADLILSVRSETLPNLGTLVGKLIAETGLLGLFLFLRIWPKALMQAKAMLQWAKGDPMALNMAVVAGFAVVGNLVGFTLKHGSFALPFFWFWLGYIDGRYRAAMAR